MDKKDFIAIIPARYGSSRMPGKPLMKIGGVEMIIRVCRAVASAGIAVVVATDDVRIKDCVERFGYEAVMTSEHHKSGTDRVKEAYDILKPDAKVIINVQGDEPFILADQIYKLMSCFDDSKVEVATLAHKYDSRKGFEELFDSNLVKVVFDSNHDALYFSRSIIPYVRNYEWKEWVNKCEFYTHVGIYAYKVKTLEEITLLPQCDLEKAESLEQLRLLNAGKKIRIAITDVENIGIDTPEDLKRAEEYALNKSV